MKRSMKRTLSLLLILALTLCLFAPVSAADGTAAVGGAPCGLCRYNGALCVSDSRLCRVLMLTDNGCDVLAGSGEAGYIDGKANISAFDDPRGLAEFMGGLVVADAGNNVLRIIRDGTVSTLAGSGKAAKKDGNAAKAAFDFPTGLASDGDRLYIADTGSGAIRMLSKDGTVSTVLTGLLEPTALCLKDGTLFICETGKNRILAYDGKELRVLAGTAEADDEGFLGGYADTPAASARFDAPVGIAAGENGALYISDSLNGVIRKLENGRVYTVAELSGIPAGLLRMNGSLYVCDSLSGCVCRIEENAAVFADVAEDAWYASAVTEMAKRGILNGMGDGVFEPAGNCTRAMFAKLLGVLRLASDGSTVLNGDSSFPDVPENSWYASYVRWLSDEGLVKGIDGEFRPGDAITREQFVTFLYRYAGAFHEVIMPETAQSFTDAERISDYAEDAVHWATGNGIVHGYTDGSFRPKNTITRAEAAQLLLNFSDAMGI